MSTQPFESHATSAVVITIGEVYAEVRQMHEEIKSLVAGIKPLARQVDDHEQRLRDVDGLPVVVGALEKQGTDHETRLRQVERRAAMYAGGAAVLAGSAGSLITWALTAHH